MVYGPWSNASVLLPRRARSSHVADFANHHSPWGGVQTPVPTWWHGPAPATPARDHPFGIDRPVWCNSQNTCRVNPENDPILRVSRQRHRIGGPRNPSNKTRSHHQIARNCHFLGKMNNNADLAAFQRPFHRSPAATNRPSHNRHIVHRYAHMSPVLRGPRLSRRG